MKTLSLRNRRRLLPYLGWCFSLLFIATVFIVYRWAEPSPAILRGAHSVGGGTATVRLLDTPFAGYMNGERTWSIHAGQVDLLRLPNAALTNIQSAQVLDITNGALYDPPLNPAHSVHTTSVHLMEAGAKTVDKARIGATFSAKHGRYSLGMLQLAPPDIEMLYNVQWQFRLMGDVVFRTRTGDQLTAPSLTIYSLTSRKSGKLEQRVLCDEGAKMTHRGIAITANSMRYSPKDRTVECLSGVRGTFKAGNVQAERVFWSLDDEVLRCPESASGTVKNIEFVCQGLTLDVKNGKHHFAHFKMTLPKPR